MTTATPFRPGDDGSVALHEHFDCSQEEAWSAIIDSSRLSEWLGGAVLDRAARRWRGAASTWSTTASPPPGSVRACSPPRPGMAVAHLEHTFVERSRPDLEAVCVWSVVISDDGCDLHFTMDGAGELGGPATSIGSRLFEGDEPSTTADHALEILAAAKTILVVDWVLPEIPEVIAALDANVHAKIGPSDDDWARLEPTDGGFEVVPAAPPDRADLLHLDWTLGFDEFVGVARSLDVRTFWYHSARTRPPVPADNRGCWVPRRQSTRQRARVEASGMAYIDDVYIVDVARRLLAG